MSVEIEHLYSVGACSEEIYEELGVYQRAHVPPRELRRFAEQEWWQEVGWPKREWWREIPFSIMHPDAEPCGDEESILLVPCKRTDRGAFPVTVLRTERVP